MKITSTLKAKGSIIDGLKAVKKFSNTKFLADKIDSKDFFKVGTVNEIKDTIKGTVGLKSLKRSTVEIRKQRREGKGGKKPPVASNLRKPLIETGNLLNSIKAKKTKVRGKKIQMSIELLDYGLIQANGFQVDTGGDFREGACDGRTVPPRDFITKATKKGAEELRKGLIQTYGEAVAERRRIGQRTL